MTAQPRLAVSAVVFNERGQVLLVRRSHPPNAGKWSLPGGKLEAGETLAAAVIREVGEETGLAVEPGPLVTAVEAIGIEAHYVILTFLASVARSRADAGDEGTPHHGSDAGDTQWLDPTSLPCIDATDGLAAVIAEATRMHQHPHPTDASVRE